MLPNSDQKVVSALPPFAYPLLRHGDTQTNTPYNAATWAKRLGRKLSFFHWSTPTSSLPDDHADFVEGRQVNFASLCNSSSPEAPNLPSTVQIDDLELDSPTTDDKTPMTENCIGPASLPCKQTTSLPCLQADGLPCQHAAELPAMAAEQTSGAGAAPTTETWAETKALLLKHSLPKARQRTDVYVTSQGGDFLEPSLQGARVSPQPLLDFLKLLRGPNWGLFLS